MTKSNKKTIVISAALCAVMSVCGIMAYFTDNDSAENNLTIGEVKIDLQEPAWDALPDTNHNNIPDVAEKVVPTQTIAKDPRVKNVGTSNAYIFLKVTIPRANVITANTDGTRKAASAQMLFNPQETAASTVWVPIGTPELTSTSATYLYAYRGDHSGAVAPGETTVPLFTGVQFINAIEGQGLENSAQNINIEAYGIQSEGFAAPATSDDIYAIYQTYMKQNS